MSQMSFDREFQIGILALMMQDFSFTRSVAEVLTPDQFEDSVLGWFFQSQRDFYQDFGQRIEPAALKNELKKALKNTRSGIDKKNRPEAKRIYKALSKPITNPEYLRKEVLTFARRQAIKDAIIESGSLLKNNDFDEIESVLGNAFRRGTDFGTIGTQYFKDYPDRVIRRHREWLTIPTLIPELDVNLRGNGLKRGHMGLWLAPSKRGKTMALIRVAKAAVIYGMTVVFYSLEMDEDDIADRFDQTWTGRTYDQLDSDLGSLYESLGRMGNKYGESALVIKQYPTKTATVPMLRSHLHLCQGEGIHPDLIVVDYGAIMKPVVHYNEKRHTIGSIYEDLRGLGGEFDAGVWSALQTNRGALQKDVVEADDASESFDPIMIADLVVSLSQTNKEKAADIMRLFITANRHGPQQRTVKIRNDFTTATFAKKRVGSSRIK